MTTPSVYVGTYAKYNNGDLTGDWVNLEGLDKDSFYEAIKALHDDEEDPEFMFQGYQGFPDSFYGECGLSDGLWDWLELSQEDRDLLEAYQDAVDATGTIEQARDAFYGNYLNDIDFADEYIESTGLLSSIPDNLQCYFDTERFARDLMHDFSEANGFYFTRY